MKAMGIRGECEAGKRAIRRVRGAVFVGLGLAMSLGASAQTAKSGAAPQAVPVGGVQMPQFLFPTINNTPRKGTTTSATGSSAGQSGATGQQVNPMYQGPAIHFFPAPNMATPGGPGATPTGTGSAATVNSPSSGTVGTPINSATKNQAQQSGQAQQPGQTQQPQQSQQSQHSQQQAGHSQIALDAPAVGGAMRERAYRALVTAESQKRFQAMARMRAHQISGGAKHSPEMSQRIAILRAETGGDPARLAARRNSRQVVMPPLATPTNSGGSAQGGPVSGAATVGPQGAATQGQSWFGRLFGK